MRNIKGLQIPVNVSTDNKGTSVKASKKGVSGFDLKLGKLLVANKNVARYRAGTYKKVSDEKSYVPVDSISGVVNNRESKDAIDKLIDKLAESLSSISDNKKDRTSRA